MASSNFRAFDRNLRHIYRLDLVHRLDPTRKLRLRVSPARKAHIGLPTEAEPVTEPIDRLLDLAATLKKH